MAKIKKAQFGTGLIKKGKAYLKKLEDEGNYQTKSFKTADSLRYANPKSKDLVGKVKERESNRRKADSIENVIEKRFNMPRKYNLYDNKKDGGKVKKAQAGTALDSYKKASKKSAVNAKADAAYTKSSFKTADSLRSAFPKVDPKLGLTKFLEERKANKAKADSIEGAVERRIGVPRKLNMYSQKNGGVTKKAQSGAALTEMGKKTTRAAINKRTDDMAKSLNKASVFGKNYIAPGDTARKAVKKAVPKKKNGGTVSSQLGSYKGVIGKNTKGKATKAVGLVKANYGKSMGKCKYGC